MTDYQFWWYMLVNTIVAVGTVGTVVVALFGDALKAKLFPPLFRVTLVNLTGEKTRLTNAQTGEYVDDVRYYHLRVANEKRRSPAKSLDVRLIRMEEPGPDGQLQPMWVGDVPIRCRHQELYPLRQEIGSPIDYDLCSVTKSRRLSLHPIVAPNNLPNYGSGPCRFVASFQAKSTQLDSHIVRIEVAWDGKWEDGNVEMATHFKVRLLAAGKQ